MNHSLRKLVLAFFVALALFCSVAAAAETACTFISLDGDDTKGTLSFKDTTASTTPTTYTFTIGQGKLTPFKEQLSKFSAAELTLEVGSVKDHSGAPVNTDISLKLTIKASNSVTLKIPTGTDPKKRSLKITFTGISPPSAPKLVDMVECDTSDKKKLNFKNGTKTSVAVTFADDTLCTNVGNSKTFFAVWVCADTSIFTDPATTTSTSMKKDEFAWTVTKDSATTSYVLKVPFNAVMSTSERVIQMVTTTGAILCGMVTLSAVCAWTLNYSDPIAYRLGCIASMIGPVMSKVPIFPKVGKVQRSSAIDFDSESPDADADTDELTEDMQSSEDSGAVSSAMRDRSESVASETEEADEEEEDEGMEDGDSAKEDGGAFTVSVVSLAFALLIPCLL